MPPDGLPGLDPRWSRLVQVTDLHHLPRTFHLLDSAADGGTPADVPAGPEPIGTLLCVHGNPTWSYLWRRLVASPPQGWRVVAPDQLGMGYSERIERPRVLAERVDDLGRLTDALGITGPGASGPVVVVAHDWGGIVSLGWAEQHAGSLSGIVLTNTAVHQPGGTPGPVLIRLARLPLVNRISCRWTPLFVRATTSLTWPRLPPDVRAAFAAPYRSAGRRAAVGEFVSDIPFDVGHPSHGAAEAIADAVPGLTVPALILWGPRDPVFGEVHLRDLRARLPQAVLHRYEQASHLVTEDAPGYVSAVTAWIGRLRTAERQPAVGDGGRAGGAAPTVSTVPTVPTVPTGEYDGRQDQGAPVLAQLTARADDPAWAVVEVGGRSITFSELDARVGAIAAGMGRAGLRPGDRVALMIPPSVELTVALYAVWRAGGVIVVADKGLGLRGMGRALRSARLDYLIADRAGLIASRFMRLPGSRISVRDSIQPKRGMVTSATLMNRIGRVAHTVPALARDGAGHGFAPDAAPDDEAAVLFTSGATGPAKGVLYRHRQVRAQLELIRQTYRLTRDDRIVAAFAPFALYGPALGLASVVPRTDVTKPGRLTAAALADAAAAIDATVVFASPAALRNVVATAGALSAGQRRALSGVRLVMSAGASVPAELLRQVAGVLSNADLHTPYGMTEALPLTDISLAEIERAGMGEGVCVGRPVAGVCLRIAPLDSSGVATDTLSAHHGVTGEIWARADHIRDRYDSAWMTDMAAAAYPGWHRTGDVGHLDAQGRLWVQGRTVHIISTPDGPVTPVGIELRVQAALAGSGLAVGQNADVAAVGVGPAGIQQVVVVLTGAGGPLAPSAVIDTVRRAAGRDVASVLITKALPVDIRHNSKIDRVAVAGWAARILAGG